MLLEQRAQRGLPARAERRHPQRSREQRGVGATVHVEQCVDGRNRHPLTPGRDLDDVVAGLHRTFFEDPEVEAGATVTGEQRRHARLVHANTDPVARHPRLRDLEQRRADAVTVADAHLVVGEPVDREVLTELAEDEVVPVELLAPITVRVELIHVHGALLAAVAREIALAVAVDVQPSDQTRTLHWFLPDPREDGPPLPADLSWHPDVDRHKCGDTR